MNRSSRSDEQLGSAELDSSQASDENRSVTPAVDTGVAMRGGALRVAGYACGVRVSLCTATSLVRHLGIPRFGRYVTITSLVALVGGMTEAGIVVYGIREFMARGEHDRRALMENLLGLRLALAAAGVACAACFGL